MPALFSELTFHIFSLNELKKAKNKPPNLYKLRGLFLSNKFTYFNINYQD